MNCRAVTGQLTAYLDGELEPATASAVRGHLRLCAACRGAAEDHATIRDRLAELERPEPSAAVWNGVLDRLGQAEIADARRSRWARLLERLRPHLVPAGLAATACAAAVLVMQLRSGGDDGRAASPVSPPAAGAPIATMVPAPPAPPPRPLRDASAELADEAARIDARFRTTVADLLPLARAEQHGAGVVRFDREIAALEASVLRAPAGKARDHAWHTLVAFLERATLGEPAARLALSAARR